MYNIYIDTVKAGVSLFKQVGSIAKVKEVIFSHPKSIRKDLYIIFKRDGEIFNVNAWEFLNVFEFDYNAKKANKKLRKINRNQLS